MELLGLPGVAFIVLSIHAICGGLLICCAESRLAFLRVIIAVNFGFLFHSVWRFFFYLLLSSICLSYNSPLATIVACVLITLAFCNTYALRRYQFVQTIPEIIGKEFKKQESLT